MSDLEALYGIEFESIDLGYGVVVLETGRVLGGDSSFVYIGGYKFENGVMVVDVKCRNYRKVVPSVFDDNEDCFRLHLEGTTATDKFILTGYKTTDESKRIKVTFTRIAELP